MPLDATTSDEAATRKARQLAYVVELQAIAMALARTNAQTAAAQNATVEAAHETDPDTQAGPGPIQPRDPILALHRLARIVGQAITLENRIVAGDDGHRPRHWRHTHTVARPLDQRRPLIRRALEKATTEHPDRAKLRRELDARLDDDLAADPDKAIEAIQIFVAISEDFALPIELKHLPDELLGFNPADFRNPFQDR